MALSETKKLKFGVFSEDDAFAWVPETECSDCATGLNSSIALIELAKEIELHPILLGEQDRIEALFPKYPTSKLYSIVRNKTEGNFKFVFTMQSYDKLINW